MIPADLEPLRLDEQEGHLRRGALSFDAWKLRWQADERPVPAGPALAPWDALGSIARLPGFRRVPVGIIGPKKARPEHLDIAEELGRQLAQSGLQVLTGGRGGVMEAACRGALAAGGQPIGLTPDDEWESANDYVAIPLATGLGPARNAVIARACEVLVAVGGEYGTLSEMAFGMHFDRLVLALLDAPQVPGVPRCAGVAAALDLTARRLLRLDR